MLESLVDRCVALRVEWNGIKKKKGITYQMFEKKMKSSHARGASRTHEFVSFDWICDPRFPLFDFLPFYFFFVERMIWISTVLCVRGQNDAAADWLFIPPPVGCSRGIRSGSRDWN